MTGLGQGDALGEVAARWDRLACQNRLALFDPDHADPDMVDEMARKELNVVHPDEVIVPLK
jgi:cell division protein FtsB